MPCPKCIPDFPAFQHIGQALEYWMCLTARLPSRSTVIASVICFARNLFNRSDYYVYRIGYRIQMSTNFGCLALALCEPSASKVAKRIMFAYISVAALLLAVFGLVAFSALIGTIVGISVLQVAAETSRAIVSATNADSWKNTMSFAEARAAARGSMEAACQCLRSALARSFCAVSAGFGALKIVHVGLLDRLCRPPKSLAHGAARVY